MTHTYVTMDISSAAYDEIRRKLEAAGYMQALIERRDGHIELDMHGIALTHTPRSAQPEPPPVDRTQRVMTSGEPVTADYREINLSTGMQKDYVVLSAEERAKGFVCPVRRSYVHKTCGVTTTMGVALAETYARDPGFYNGTFCVQCHTHFPLDQFVWAGTEEQVGS